MPLFHNNLQQLINTPSPQQGQSQPPSSTYFQTEQSRSFGTPLSPNNIKPQLQQQKYDLNTGESKMIYPSNQYHQQQTMLEVKNYRPQILPYMAAPGQFQSPQMMFHNMRDIFPVRLPLIGSISTPVVEESFSPSSMSSQMMHQTPVPYHYPRGYRYGYPAHGNYIQSQNSSEMSNDGYDELYSNFHRGIYTHSPSPRYQWNPMPSNLRDHPGFTPYKSVGGDYEIIAKSNDVFSRIPTPSQRNSLDKLHDVMINKPGPRSQSFDIYADPQENQAPTDSRPHISSQKPKDRNLQIEKAQAFSDISMLDNVENDKDEAGNNKNSLEDHDMASHERKDYQSVKKSPRKKSNKSSSQDKISYNSPKPLPPKTEYLGNLPGFLPFDIKKIKNEKTPPIGNRNDIIKEITPRTYKRKHPLSNVVTAENEDNKPVSTPPQKRRKRTKKEMAESRANSQGESGQDELKSAGNDNKSAIESFNSSLVDMNTSEEIINHNGENQPPRKKLKFRNKFTPISTIPTKPPILKSFDDNVDISEVESLPNIGFFSGDHDSFDPENYHSLNCPYCCIQLESSDEWSKHLRQSHFRASITKSSFQQSGMCIACEEKVDNC